MALEKRKRKKHENDEMSRNVYGRREIPHSGTIQLAAVWVVLSAIWKTRALIGPKRGRSPTVNGVPVSKVLMSATHVIAGLNARCCQI